MSFRRITCIIAVCDISGCGNSQDPDGGVPHFPTETEAGEHILADPDCYANVWHRRPDGRLVCWIRDPLHDWAREQDGKSGPGVDAMSVTLY
ncbi:hypothetical protein [Streptomyces sp. WAC05858]|uniref:hypothetical protein n=1 Tax=Streptomyces TaxID=1883 RepID=UPI000F769782|nr:hypothetical protein [Streptomyces sp. WAC05858]RSS37950.1 hypothetical protein EF902_31620 [Streptomyces sp. WAC05858]